MRLTFALLFACTWMSASSHSASAQQPTGERPATSQGENWSYEQSYPAKPDPRAIIQYKAQVRAAQRMDRMAAMQWYGMSNARPTASATPFTTMYSPAWQMPGGRPFAWFNLQNPPVIIIR